MTQENTRRYREGDTAKLMYLNSGDVFALIPTEFRVKGLGYENGFFGQTGSGMDTFYMFEDFLEDITVAGNGQGKEMVVVEGERYTGLQEELKRFQEARERWLGKYRSASGNGRH